MDATTDDFATTAAVVATPATSQTCTTAFFTRKAV
jgi:hypothetical protein